MSAAALLAIAAFVTAGAPPRATDTPPHAADGPPHAAGAVAAPSAAEAPTRTLRTGGRTFGFRSVGRGRPVVLIQGLSGTIDGWDPTFVDALAREHRVILFDNAGVGRTSSRAGTLSIRGMADDAHRVIRALGLRRPDVVGWSMGGMIAQSLAVRRPHALRRLVLLATAPGDGGATPPTREGLAALAGEGGAATEGGVLFPPGQEAAQRRFLRNLARRRTPDLRAPAAVTAAQIGASATWLSGGDADGRRIRQLRMRVLVGGGELDPLLPVANQRRLARVIPRARLITYADASHAFFLQRSRDFVPRLRRFLR